MTDNYSGPSVVLAQGEGVSWSDNFDLTSNLTYVSPESLAQFGPAGLHRIMWQTETETQTRWGQISLTGEITIQLDFNYAAVSTVPDHGHSLLMLTACIGVIDVVQRHRRRNRSLVA